VEHVNVVAGRYLSYRLKTHPATVHKHPSQSSKIQANFFFMNVSGTAVLLLLLSTNSISNSSEEAEATKVAAAYLSALAGTGDDHARELLLGGVTMDAEISSLENWRIISKETLKHEEANLERALHLMNELDEAGRHAARKIMKTQGRGNEMTVSELSQSEALKLLAPTKEKAQNFSAACPLLAYIARVGKDAYWHPKNPIRKVLANAGKHGTYVLQLQRFKIETREGPRQVAREWPLRVLRFRTAGVDTGWKILPASDWSRD
jgi:hypothetical protein